MEPEERRRLAEKLECELDDFINDLQKNGTGYNDGWPEDRWEEEMDKHPFFMKRAPDPSSGEELPPLIDGLAKLKFDPDENSPAELAANYKEDGNFYFKNGNYRCSVVSYTEGLKIKCGDAQIEAALLNNRAQAHYNLGNYRSSLNDAVRALGLDGNYSKCKSRAAKCAYKLLDFSGCLKYCNDYLLSGKDPSLEKLRGECEKVLRESAMKADALDTVLASMRKKGIKFYDPSDEAADVKVYLSSIPSIESPAHLDRDTDIIIWPVYVLYPQYDVYDYYREFPESLPVRCLVEEILAEPAEWDEKREYAADRVDVFYIGRDIEDLHSIDVTKSLLDVMTEKHFYLRRMSPTLVIKLKKKENSGS